MFDPGINALSILTEILPNPVHLRAATLEFTEPCDTPIAAQLTFSGNVSADFDWRQTGPQTWDIAVETPKGQLDLRMGGNVLEIDGQCDVDLSPMIHLADALTLCLRKTVFPFQF